MVKGFVMVCGYQRDRLIAAFYSLSFMWFARFVRLEPESSKASFVAGVLVFGLLSKLLSSASPSLSSDQCTECHSVSDKSSQMKDFATMFTSK